MALRDVGRDRLELLTTESPGYREDLFYTRSSDKEGRSATVRARIPPELDHELDRLVASRAIPHYDTKAAIIRDALHHRVKTIADMLDKGRFAANVRMYLSLANAEAQQNEMRATAHYIERIQDVMREAIRTGDWVVAKDLYDNGRQLVGELRDPYRKELNETLEKYRARFEDDFAADAGVEGQMDIFDVHFEPTHFET